MTYCDIQELREYIENHLLYLDDAAEAGDDDGVIAGATKAILTLQKLREDMALDGWTECDCEKTGDQDHGPVEITGGKPC